MVFFLFLFFIGVLAKKILKMYILLKNTELNLSVALNQMIKQIITNIDKIYFSNLK